MRKRCAATAIGAAGVAFFACARPAAAQTAATTDTTDPPASPAEQRVLPPAARSGEAIGGATTAWNPKWQYKVGVYDFVITGAGVAAAVGAAIVPPGDAKPTRWQFDEDVRDKLRISSTVGRYHARDASDVGVSLLTTWPILIDALVTSWWDKGNPTVARNIAVVDAEVIALVAAGAQVTTVVASRERPFGRDCASDALKDNADCELQTRGRSFFSGHASQSFAGAGVLCVNHLGMKLLGPAGDTATCAIAIGVAAATGTFRIMGDMHYASDVLTGMLVGSVVGVGVPLLHGHTVGDATTSGLRLRIVPVDSGLGVGGAF